jgi:hypothetical protein
MALDKITSDSLAAGAVNVSALPDGVVSAAKLHTTAISDKLGYTPVSPTDLSSGLALKANASALTNVENKSSATIRSEISSSNVTTALGFTPMIGDGTYNGNTSINLNDIVTSGSYRIGATAVNLPTGAGGYGQLFVMRMTDTIAQIYVDYSTGASYTRGGNPSSVGGGGAFSAWHFSNSIGTSQTWTDVIGSRAGSTTYTNSTGKPICVFIQGSNAPSNGSSTIYVNGAAIGGLNNYGTSGGCSFIVPNGATYSITFSGSSLYRWNELR